MAKTAVLERETFEISRTSEYFDPAELEKQTGQPRSKFGAVVLKELVDNALDAAEGAGIAPAIEIEARQTGRLLTLSVTDNGSGIPPETVGRITNFDTRTSDKLAYRSPTRGAQGNALKTIIGIPHALGSSEPVAIRSRGVEHRIYTKVNPAGDLHINPVVKQAEPQDGTTVTVTMPIDDQAFNPQRLARSFALFNPHASVKFSISAVAPEHGDEDDEDCVEFYQSSVPYPDGWRKWLPTDPTSPHWYSAADLKRLVFSHIGLARRGGKDLTLRDFVRQFSGLSGTQKAKAVCDEFTQITRLSDFEQREDDVESLLEVMKGHAREVKAEALGVTGKDHFNSRFDEWYGVKRFWYQKKLEEAYGIPFIFEIAVAETEEPGTIFTALNFSPSYGDPFADTWLMTEEITSTGIGGFLRQAYAHPDSYERDGHPYTAVAVHLVCPVLDFLDRGKTRLELPAKMPGIIAKAVWDAVKELYREGKRRKKDATREDRRAEAREKPQEMTLKDAVFQVMPAAISKTTLDGDFPVSKRDLYYDVRDRIQPLTPKELDYDYFAQNLLKQYQEIYGKIPRLYSESRGWLIEPHTGEKIRLGTREVDSYQFPLWLYNKILYTEKQGLWEKLEFGKFAERYDMAIIMGQGYATEAVYTLLERADRDRNYQIFVLHDADPDGYQIALKMREAAERFPDSNVNIVDLGLSYDDAMKLELSPEKFTRKKALPSGIQLTPLAEKAFTGVKVGKKHWKDCLRVELNKLDFPTFIKYVDDKLVEHGATDKVIPPDDELAKLVDEMYCGRVGMRTRLVINELLSTEKIIKHLIEDLREKVPLSGARKWVKRAFNADKTLDWRAAVERQLDEKISALSDKIKDAVRESLQ